MGINAPQARLHAQTLCALLFSAIACGIAGMTLVFAFCPLLKYSKGW